MIGPTESYETVNQLVLQVGYLTPLERPVSDSDLDVAAGLVAPSVGIVFDPQPGLGQYMIRQHGDRQVQMERHRLYAAVPANAPAIVAAVGSFVREIARLHGPGRVWSTGGRVHLISDEANSVRSPTVEMPDGPTQCVLMRAFYFHEPAPAILTIRAMDEAVSVLADQVRDEFTPKHEFSNRVQEIEAVWLRMGTMLDRLRVEESQ